mgnify:FL=1|tara:strand:- start:31 stop:210 length:180 start_codon:yes stop_codon:yes gene_type:complete
MTYKFFKGTSDKVQTNCILRKEDNAIVPFDEANTDYQEYLKWLNGEDPYTEKGTPEAAD